MRQTQRRLHLIRTHLLAAAGEDRAAPVPAAAIATTAASAATGWGQEEVDTRLRGLFGQQASPPGARAHTYPHAHALARTRIAPPHSARARIRLPMLPVPHRPHARTSAYIRDDGTRDSV